MSTPYPRINSDLATLLVEAKQTLLSKAVANAVWITADPQQWAKMNVPNVPDDRIILITPGRQVLDQSSTAGGGIDFNFVEGTLLVTILNRNSSDQAGQDDIGLTDPTYGMLPLLSQVITAWQVTDLVDPVSGQYITAEPMRFIAIEAPAKVGLPGWSVIQGTFEIHWTLTLPGQIN